MKLTINELRNIIKFKSYEEEKHVRSIFNAKDREEMYNYLSGYE